MSVTGTVPVKVAKKLSELELDAGGKKIDNLGLGDTPDDVMRRSEKTGDNEVYGLLAAGLAANRPAPGIADRFYFSTDTLVLERDTGAAWVEVVRGETATRLAQLAERAHGSLTGITPDQHHARDHHTRHEPGGADEVTGVVPGDHAASHESGGGDEINVAGLLGETVELANHKADLANPHQVTADQAGAIPDVPDAVKDSHVDWGSGAGQVDADDIPESVTKKWAAESGADVTANHAPKAHEATHVDGGTDEIDSALDPRAYPMLAGTLAARPAVGVAGRFYWTTDEHILYRDTGAAWVKVAVADYPDLDSIPASFTPSAHKDTHDPEDGTDKLDTAAGSTIQPNDVAAVGTSHSFSRADHKHAIATAAPVKVGAANAEGTSTSFARADHVHEREHARYTDVEALAQAKANIEDIPVNGHTEQGASSNWAYDHEHDDDVHKGTAINVEEIDAATYDDLQDWLNNIQSSGRISGGGITDNGNGTVKVAAGTGFIKAADSDIALTKFFDWDEEASVVLADNNANYIYLDYNAGSPQILVTTDRASIRTTDQFMIARVYRSGFNLDILEAGVILFNHTRLEHERLLAVRGFERASGGVISETGQRYLVSTPGVFYLGHNRMTTPGKDTSGIDTFTAWYYDGTAWVSVAGQAQISNTQYNDITSGLVNLAANRYGVHWIYIGYDGSLHSVYGQGSYRLAEAQAALAPGDIPSRLSAFAKLAAKVIVKKDAANFTTCESAYAALFPVSTPPDHNDLGGIQGGAADEYYHLTEAQHTNNVIKTGALTAGKMVKTNADGVVEDATNTDAEVADAVTKRHDRSHDHSNALDGSPIAEAGVPNHMSKNKLAFTLNKILKGAGAGADPVEIDVPAGDMTKAIYDPDADGKIALAQLVDAVCSEAEADTKIATHAGLLNVHSIPRVATLVVAANNSSAKSKSQADYVCTGVNDHLTIQDAIDALPAAGGEVKLLEGTYNVEATINLDSNQTLKGCGRSTILTTSTVNLIFLSAIGASGTEKTGIVIADLQIDGGAGAVSDCGIYFEYVDYSFILDVYSRRHASATGSYLSGIYLLNSDFNKIIANTCVENAYGIHLTTYSKNNIVSGNTCVGNTYGIYLTTYSNYSTVSGNTCQGNTDYGICLTNSSNNTASGNICMLSTNGICLGSGANYNAVSGNTCWGNTEGIRLVSAATKYNTISGNTCVGNTDGIYLSLVWYNTVSGNTCVENTQWGIFLSSSHYNTISGNTCVGNVYGIYLTSAWINTISGNTCVSSTQWGIFLASSSNNTIIGNTLTENSQSANNAYDDIYLESSDYNNIQTNTCRAGDLTNKPRYGINISNAACDGNLVTNNDIYNDGFGTGSFNDAGTGTVTVAGNRT